MAKSLFVSDDTHRSLMLAKMELGFRSVDDMLKEIVAEVRKARFLEASDTFTSRMREKRLSLLFSRIGAKQFELSCSKGGSGKTEDHSRCQCPILSPLQTPRRMRNNPSSSHRRPLRTLLPGLDEGRGSKEPS